MGTMGFIETALVAIALFLAFTLALSDSAQQKAMARRAALTPRRRDIDS